MNTLLIIAWCTLLHSLSSDARTFYISSSSGNDANDGLTPARAWRSITKVNATNLVAGDTVLFKRGDVFEGEITSESGSVGKPIVFMAYGAGNNPVISGARRLPSIGWKTDQGSIALLESVTMPSHLDGEAPVLLMNGRVMIAARFPNEEYRIADSAIGQNPGSHCCEASTALIDRSLPSHFPISATLVGANVTAYDPYGVSTRRITKYDPSRGRLDFDTLRGASLLGYRYYFLSASRSFLDQAGEWFYDPAARSLYVWTPDGIIPTASDTIAYTSYSYGFNLYETSNVTIRDLDFRGQQIAGVWIIRSKNITISDCSFMHAKHGVYCWGAAGPPEITVDALRIERCRFAELFRTAINARNLRACAIVANQFNDIGRWNALGQSGTADFWKNYGSYEFGIGIQASGYASIIERNVLIRCGRQAITTGGPGVVTRYNVIDWPCILYNDCGGIMPLGDGLVERNIITNSFGWSWEHRWQGARGIYPDFRNRDTIRGNTIVNTVIGIGLTNAKNVTVLDNTIYNFSFIGFRMNKKDGGRTNNLVRGNTFFNLSETATAFVWENLTSEIDAATLDSNEHWNPYITFPTIKYTRDSTSGEGLFDFAGWQATGRERGSTKEFVSYPSRFIVRDTVGSNIVTNSQFESGTAGWQYSDSLTVEFGRLDGGCARVKKNSSGSKTLWTSLTRSLDSNAFYLVRFSVNDPSNIGRILLRLRHAGNAQRVFQEKYFLTKSMRRDESMIVHASESAAARLEFISSNSLYWLDNVTVEKVNVDARVADALFPISINASDGVTSIRLSPRYRYFDLDSNRVTGSLALGPYESKILVLLDSTTTRVVDSSPLLFKLDVYPNPSFDGNVRITSVQKLQHDVRIEAFDVLGRRVSDNVIDATSLASGTTLRFNSSGIYRICATSGDDSHMTKVIVVSR